MLVNTRIKASAAAATCLTTYCQKIQIAAVARPASSAEQDVSLQFFASVADSVPAFWNRMFVTALVLMAAAAQRRCAHAPLPRRRRPLPTPGRWPPPSRPAQERSSGGWCRKQRAPAISGRNESVSPVNRYLPCPEPAISAEQHRQQTAARAKLRRQGKNIVPRASQRRSIRAIAHSANRRWCDWFQEHFPAKWNPVSRKKML